MTTVNEFVREKDLGNKRIPEETKELFPCKSKIQVWAAANAYTLIFLSLMFFVSYVLSVVTILVGVGVFNR